MKSKALVILSTLVMALGLMAQNATQSTPAPASNDAKACACCDQAKAPDGKMACEKGKGCCGKDAKCCGGEMMSSKDGKAAKACPMMSKDKNGKMACCADGKCPMMAKGKGKGCCGDKCPMATTSSINAKPDCCVKGGACCAKGGACCMSSAVAASHSCCGGHSTAV